MILFRKINHTVHIRDFISVKRFAVVRVLRIRNSLMMGTYLPCRFKQSTVVLNADSQPAGMKIIDWGIAYAKTDRDRSVLDLALADIRRKANRIERIGRQMR